MARKRILIVDDDPDILDVLKIILEDQYDVVAANNGEEALEKIYPRPPDLVLLDNLMPKLNGIEVCQHLKKDLLLRHLPVIMLTGKGEVSDKVKGINAGVDDYIVKPFEPEELLARVKMILRRTELDLDANPLTKLPGNVSIFNEIERQISKKELFAVYYIDLDKFKIYNDNYGFERGDELIRETARILIKAVQEKGTKDSFIGHIGGDDFVIITHPDVIDSVCSKIIKDFETLAPNLYSKEDRQRGYILGKDRQGKDIKTPFISISIGVVTNEHREISHVAQIGEIGAELKKYAKSLERSNYVRDKRKLS